MHFLAHLHAQRSHLNPEFTLGLILPDLFLGFTKIYNQKIAYGKLTSLNENVRNISSGVIAHFSDDKLFHQLHEFDVFCSELMRNFVEKGLNRNELRLSFLAHLFIEMLLDRWLCEQNGNLPFQFYRMLEQLNTQSVHLFCNELKINETTALVLEKRIWFLANRFLHELHNTEQMTRGVSKIYGRLTGREITKNEQFRIIESVNKFYAIPQLWQMLLIR